MSKDDKVMSGKFKLLAKNTGSPRTIARRLETLTATSS